ncbi:ATP-binding protein [Alcaligenaceae bacterium CGII-47]|nr:ATP-binding protein [Alcaligenaceae bacterium CGII-47]
MQTFASMRLAPGADTVTEAMAWLALAAQQQDWSAGLAFKLGLCLDEALTNVLAHGFKDLPQNGESPVINLALSVEDGRIVIDIFDNGIPFDPTQKTPKPPAKNLDDTEIGGHGLRLMHHYLENIQYRRADQRNHLRLIATLDT